MKLALTALKVTEVAPVKFVPLIVTLVAAGPLAGVKLPIVGGLTTVKLSVLVTVPLGVVTLSGPVVASAGTVAWIAVSEPTVKLALTELNVTAVVPVKFVPLIVTLVPTGPLPGAKLAIAGAPPAVSPPSQPVKVNAGVSASIPTSPVGKEPSVVYLNWETPFLNTSRVFPSAVSLHLSPGTMVAVKNETGVKLPSGLSL